MHVVLSEIREMNMIVDFNQGLDAGLIDDEKANARAASLNIQ